MAGHIVRPMDGLGARSGHAGANVNTAHRMPVHGLPTSVARRQALAAPSRCAKRWRLPVRAGVTAASVGFGPVVAGAPPIPGEDTDEARPDGWSQSFRPWVDFGQAALPGPSLHTE